MRWMAFRKTRSATDRLQELPDDRLALRFKQAWRDGTTHIVFTIASSGLAAAGGTAGLRAAIATGSSAGVFVAAGGGAAPAAFNRSSARTSKNSDRQTTTPILEATRAWTMRHHRRAGAES
jgi:hypothetical protein